MATWNPFDSQAFELIELVDAVNNRDFLPGQIGSLDLFMESGSTTLTAAIEAVNGTIALVPNTPRGGPAPQISPDKRTVRDVRGPHLIAGDTIYAEELQGVRAYGMEGQLKAITAERNERLDKLTRYLDVTYEHHKLGALQGLVLDADGTTTILDIYDLMGESQAAEVNIELDETTEGATVTAISGIIRAILNALGPDAVMVDHIHALCDPTFMDNLVASTAFRDTHRFDSHSDVLRNGTVFTPFRWQNVVWEEYRLGNSGLSGGSFLGTGKCIFFPVGPAIYKTKFMPGDSLNDLNAPGLPRYVRAGQDREYDNAPRWLKLAAESNPLVYVTKPQALRRGDDGVT